MKKIDYFIGIVALFAFLLLMAELSSLLRAYAEILHMANLAILLLFIADVVLRFFLSQDKKKHLRGNWFDLIVFVPLIRFMGGIEQTPFFVIVWQVVIILMLVSRVRRANKLVTLLSLKPAQLMVTSFSFAIGMGAILLMLPAASASGDRTSLVDALFTATSATCVTGLVVKGTASHFSFFGQAVILSLIQIGGLGIMTFSVSLALLLRKRLEMQRQIVMRDVLDQDTLLSVRGLTVFIVKMTVAFELIGAALLFILWKDNFTSKPLTAYYALFHSVSAFCNAGFSTFNDSLMRFSGDIGTNITIMALIISGGLGFTVIKDLIDRIRRKKAARFRVQTKIVLAASFLFIVAGALGFYLLEAHHSLVGLGMKDRILVSLFQSVASRTAGFNTCDISALSSATLFMVIVLMFIGGSPGSTAGGIKTTTVAVLWAAIVSGFKQKEHCELHRRTIPFVVVRKAISLVLISLVIVASFFLLLLYIEQEKFSALMFEAVSAFGTVGLSTGVTALLSGKGKIVLTLLMFIGRLGPLTITYAFMQPRKPARYMYAEERVMIG
ncbi:MAG: TrkH family potassium uptake protein [Candidatus Omnitrophota bacterium]